MHDFIYYFVCSLAMLLFGISKSGFAGTAGFIALPMFVTQMPPDQALSVMLPVLCVMDLVALKVYKGIFDKKNIVMLLPAAFFGIAVGGLLFDLLSATFLKMMIASIAVLFYLQSFYLKHYFRNKTFRHKKVNGSFWGFLIGFTSTIAHSGGVPLQMYVLPQRLEKTLFVGTSVIIFAVVNYTKIIPYYFLGELNFENLKLALVFLPIAPIGIILGYYLQKRLSQERFYQICIFFLIGSVIKLFYDGLQGLL